MRLDRPQMPVCVGLVLLLLQLPVMGDSSPVGKVVPRTGVSTINGTSLQLETILYFGDIVATQSESAALMLLRGGDRVILGSLSQVTLKEYDDGLGLTLTAGVARIHTDNVALLAKGLVIRSTGERGIFEVGIVDEDALLVVAINGDVEVQATNNTVIVPMDHAMRFETKDVEGLLADPAGANRITPKRLTVIWIFITAAAVVTTYYLAWTRICNKVKSQISPSQPVPPVCQKIGGF